MDGVSEGLRASAGEEISRFFAPLPDQVKDIAVDVRVPRDFDRAVSELLVEKRGIRIPYSAARRHVVAIGKTIPILSDNLLTFVILFNAGIFQGQEPGNYLWRLGHFSHERVHVFDLVSKWEHLGADRFFTEPSTTQDSLVAFAHDTLMEYRAERLSVESFVAAAKAMENVRLGFPDHEGHLQSFMSAIEALPDFTVSTTSSFRTWQITIDALWSSVYSYLWEVLSLAAYVYAHNDALSSAPPPLASLESNRRYAFFFDSWNLILPKLRKLAAEPIDYDEARLQEIGDLLLALFERCGLSFRDTQTGIYISVRVPGLGSFDSPSRPDGAPRL